MPISFRLTRDAQQDLSAVRRYTVETWGQEQLSYLIDTTFRWKSSVVAAMPRAAGQAFLGKLSIPALKVRGISRKTDNSSACVELVGLPRFKLSRIPWQLPFVISLYQRIPAPIMRQSSGFLPWTDFTYSFHCSLFIDLSFCSTSLCSWAHAFLLFSMVTSRSAR